jgi:transcriptional regulator with XRE-family HTH domain
MSDPQIIRTPSGDELVVLTRGDYEALLERADHEAEDAEDIAIYDARKAELAAGGVVLPQEVSAAILRGDSRLKAVRDWRDQTQMYLSFKTGISQGYLSDLESGRRVGTPETIRKLAQTLEVPEEWLSEAGETTVGGLPADHPTIRAIYEVVMSAEGIKAGVEAIEAGKPAMAGVDPILQDQVPDYGGRETTTWAGYYVAAAMRKEGYQTTTSGPLPANCKAKTAMLFKRR